MIFDFSGTNVNQFARRLGNDWLALATQLEIPLHDRATWRQGFEGIEIYTWLSIRDQRQFLPPALKEIGREDLFYLFQSQSNAWTFEDENLRDILSSLYDDESKLRHLADQASVDWSRSPHSETVLDLSRDLLATAKSQGRRDALIQTVFAAHPGNTALQQAAQGNLSSIRGVDIQWQVHWRSTTSAQALEKIMGEESTILPISFLQVGLQMANSVARIVREDGTTGTGFLITGNYLVTNHHVLQDPNEANLAKAQFNVQRTAGNLDLAYEEYDLNAAAGFRTSTEDDWTVVKIQGDANARWGAVPLTPTAAAKVGGRVIVIQHPGGGPKSIALYHNVVTYADDSRVQYLTDTMPGSSGSPVFDSGWNLVAIHHSGGWLREPASKQLLFRNEGIGIRKVVEQIGDLI